MVDQYAPVIKNFDPNRLMFLSGDNEINQAQFLYAAYSLADRLPKNTYAINMCGDRAKFALVFVAMLINQQISLLPQNRTSGVINQLIKEFDPFIVSDSSEIVQAYSNVYSLVDSDLLLCPAKDDVVVPNINLEQEAVIAFTSGSTGLPKANIKKWRLLSNTADRLNARLVGQEQQVVIATVPSQHMYGLEMTILLTLCGDVALRSEIPFIQVK